MTLVKCSRPAKDGPWHPVHCRHQGWARCWTWSCSQSGRRQSTASCSLCSLCAISTHIYIYISAQRVHRRQPPISGSNITIWVSAISKKLLLLFSRTCTGFNRQGTHGQQLPMRTQTHMYEEGLLRWQKFKHTTNKFAKHGDVIAIFKYETINHCTERFHDQGFDNGPYNIGGKVS